MNTILHWILLTDPSMKVKFLKKNWILFFEIKYLDHILSHKGETLNLKSDFINLKTFSVSVISKKFQYFLFENICLLTMVVQNKASEVFSCALE